MYSVHQYMKHNWNSSKTTEIVTFWCYSLLYIQEAAMCPLWHYSALRGNPRAGSYQDLPAETETFEGTQQLLTQLASFTLVVEFLPTFQVCLSPHEIAVLQRRGASRFLHGWRVQQSDRLCSITVVARKFAALRSSVTPHSNILLTIVANRIGNF